MVNKKARAPIGQSDSEKERSTGHVIAAVIDHTATLSRIPLRCIRATGIITIGLRAKRVAWMQCNESQESAAAPDPAALHPGYKTDG
jgi:hypothetical protein